MTSSRFGATSILLTRISHIHFAEPLPQVSSPIILQSHLNFKNIPAGSTCHPARNAQIVNIVLLDFDKAFKSTLNEVFNGDIREQRMTCGSACRTVKFSTVHMRTKVPVFILLFPNPLQTPLTVQYFGGSFSYLWRINPLAFAAGVRRCRTAVILPNLPFCFYVGIFQSRPFLSI